MSPINSGDMSRYANNPMNRYDHTPGFNESAQKCWKTCDDPNKMSNFDNIKDCVDYGMHTEAENFSDSALMYLYGKGKPTDTIITIGEYFEKHPMQEKMGLAAGIVGAFVGGIAGLATGLVGQHHP